MCGTKERCNAIETCPNVNDREQQQTKIPGVQAYSKETRTAPKTAVIEARPPMRIEEAAAPVWDAGAVLLEAVAAPPTAAVPLSCSAKSWNAVKFRAEDSSELTANTMPAPQWLSGVC